MRADARAVPAGKRNRPFPGRGSRTSGQPLRIPPKVSSRATANARKCARLETAPGEGRSGCLQGGGRRRVRGAPRGAAGCPPMRQRSVSKVNRNRGARKPTRPGRVSPHPESSGQARGPDPAQTQILPHWTVSSGFPLGKLFLHLLAGGCCLYPPDKGLFKNPCAPPRMEAVGASNFPKRGVRTWPPVGGIHPDTGGARGPRTGTGACPYPSGSRSPLTAASITWRSVRHTKYLPPALITRSRNRC